jgi:MFS family permease
MQVAAPAAARPAVDRVPFYINRNYALEWCGQAISYIGDSIFDITLLLWVAARIGAGQTWAPAAVSGLLACIFVPNLLCGPVAGVFVDRWDKRRTMLVMDALRAGLVLSLLLASGIVALPFFAGGAMPTAGKLALIYLVVILTTTCQQFFGPARTALIGDIVDPDHQGRASGMAQVSQSLSMVIGPPLAAPLLFGVGVQWALVVNAMSFAVSFVTIWLIHAPPSARSVQAGEEGHAWRELVEGIRFFASNRVLMTVLISATLAMLGAGALNALDIFFVTTNLHASASLYGYISAALGIGALAGAIIASIFSERIGPARMIWFGLLAVGSGLIVYSRLTSFWPAVVLLCILGMPIAGLNVAVMPLILQTTPRELIGRVSAVLQPTISLATIASIVVAGLLVSTLLHGFHAHLLGIPFGPVDTIFTASGVTALGAGFYAFASFRRAGILSRDAAGTNGRDESRDYVGVGSPK